MQQGCRFGCESEWASLHVTEGCDDDREPQSTQSVPRLQEIHWAPGPPSSHSPSEAQLHVFEQICPIAPLSWRRSSTNVSIEWRGAPTRIAHNRLRPEAGVSRTKKERGTMQIVIPLLCVKEVTISQSRNGRNSID